MLQRVHFRQILAPPTRQKSAQSQLPHPLMSDKVSIAVKKSYDIDNHFMLAYVSL